MRGYPKVPHPNIHNKILSYPEDYVTLKQAQQILKCTHLAKYIESEFNEHEQFAYCTKCQKDLTEEYSNELEAKYGEPQLPF